jgi:geranylgeranyl diphosphate synthase type II
MIHYRFQADAAILAWIESMGPPGPLRSACEHILTANGKRLRPILVFMTADAIGKGCDVTPVAAGVEFFHVASLIADDLPCMDDEMERRGRPALHRQFGEDIALLASYTLIAAGYESIVRNRQLGGSDEAALLSLEVVSRCAGIRGATQGQLLDLHPPNNRLETILEIIEKKTVTLFEVSLAFGWLFGGGDTAQLGLVKKAAYHLGMAFQIADDLGDVEKDSQCAMPINIAICCGEAAAYNLFEENTEKLASTFNALNLKTEHFQNLLQYLEKTVV